MSIKVTEDGLQTCFAGTQRALHLVFALEGFGEGWWPRRLGPADHGALPADGLCPHSATEWLRFCPLFSLLTTWDGESIGRTVLFCANT